MNYAVIWLREGWTEYVPLPRNQDALVDAWVMAQRLKGDLLTAMEIIAITRNMAELEKQDGSKQTD